MNIRFAKHIDIVIGTIFFYQNGILDGSHFAFAFEVKTIAFTFLIISGLFGDYLHDFSVGGIALVQLFEGCTVGIIRHG